MNRTMTRYANRNYIERMFRFVAAMMMVLFSMVPAYSAMIGRSRREFVDLDGITNDIASFYIRFMFWAVAFLIFSYCYPIFDFSFLGFIVLSYAVTCTCFALSIVSNFTIFSFMKFVERFNLLALRTSFCLNCLSHSLISSIKLWLEPVSGYNPFLARSILRGNASYVK